MHLHDLQLDYVRAHSPHREALDLIHGAMRLSSHVINKNPEEFVSQIVGRLLPYRDVAAVRQFSETIAAGAPTSWLRPRQTGLNPSGGPLVRILQEADTHYVAVSGDGRRAVSACRDMTQKVWDVETGRELHILRGHASAICEVTADGRLAVSASFDKTLKVWDLESGHELRTLSGHASAVTNVAMTADGRLVASASDRTLKVWNVGTGANSAPLRTTQRRYLIWPLLGTGGSWFPPPGTRR